MTILRVITTLILLVLLAYAGASGAIAAQGDENLPCAEGGHWILSPFEGTPPTFEGLTFDKQTGKAVHYLSGPVDESNFSAIASQHEDLKLSHCLGSEATPTPTPVVEEPTPTPSPSASTPVICYDENGDETDCSRPCFACVPDTAIAAEEMDPNGEATLFTLIGAALIAWAMLTFMSNKPKNGEDD